MENYENPVQSDKKKRSQSDKIGRIKYNQQLLKKTQADIEEIKTVAAHNPFRFERVFPFQATHNRENRMLRRG